VTKDTQLLVNQTFRVKATIHSYAFGNGIAPQAQPFVTVELPWGISHNPEDRVACDGKTVAFADEGKIEVHALKNKLP
jgi:hypothetical protein